MEKLAAVIDAYDFKLIKEKKGDLICADYMLRHLEIDSLKHSYAEVYVRFAATNSVPKALNQSDFATATKDDKKLQSVISSVKTNR